MRTVAPRDSAVLGAAEWFAFGTSAPPREAFYSELTKSTGGPNSVCAAVWSEGVTSAVSLRSKRLCAIRLERPRYAPEASVRRVPVQDVLHALHAGRAVNGPTTGVNHRTYVGATFQVAHGAAVHMLDGLRLPPSGADPGHETDRLRDPARVGGIRAKARTAQIAVRVSEAAALDGR